MRLCCNQVQVAGRGARAPCSKWRELRAHAQEAVSPPARSLPRRGHKGATFCFCFLLLGFSSTLHALFCVVVVHLKDPPLSPSPFSPLDGQLFLKEDVYQLLECKRERTRQLAALTLQRYARMFFIRKRFLAFRGKIVALQARCRGFLMRSARWNCAVWARCQAIQILVKFHKRLRN